MGLLQAEFEIYRPRAVAVAVAVAVARILSGWSQGQLSGQLAMLGVSLQISTLGKDGLQSRALSLKPSSCKRQRYNPASCPGESRLWSNTKQHSILEAQWERDSW